MLKPHNHLFTLLLLILHLSFSLSTTSSDDISALKAFKAAIKPSTIPPYSCLNNIPLSLFSKYSLSDPFPSSITTLTSLQELDLSSNSLSGPLPDNLSSLSHLTRVDLSFNKFSGILPKLPPNLLELAIKANLLSGPISESSFTGLTQLETVELSANSFTGVLQSWFFKLPALQQINLSNNSLTGVEISKPDNNSGQLVAVDLSVNFTEYHALASLSLRYNRLRGPIPLQYGTMNSLKRLYLDENYLSGTPPAGIFAGKASPVVVSVGDNCLQGCPSESLLCLPAQKSMQICEQALLDNLVF